MKFEPFMLATFCDDVRQEVGNKVSYLGIYGPNLIVPTFPTTLLKLCCVLTVRLPAGSLPKRITFTLLRDDELLFEADASRDEIGSAGDASPAADAAGMATTMSTVAQLANFPITHHCFLKARAMVDGKELLGGALELLAADDNG